MVNQNGKSNQSSSVRSALCGFFFQLDEDKQVSSFSRNAQLNCQILLIKRIYWIRGNIGFDFT